MITIIAIACVISSSAIITQIICNRIERARRKALWVKELNRLIDAIERKK